MKFLYEVKLTDIVRCEHFSKLPDHRKVYNYFYTKNIEKVVKNLFTYNIISNLYVLYQTSLVTRLWSDIQENLT